MKNNVNKYFLNQLLKGCSVQMYNAEVDAIKEYLKNEKPEFVNRVVAKKQSEKSKFVLCRII